MRYCSTLRRTLTDQLRSVFPTMPEEDILISALQELVYQTARSDPDHHPLPEVPLTLIEVRSPAGLFARCDANCYDSRQPYKDCPCGGINHGVGLAEAIINMPGIISERIPALWIKHHADQAPPGTYWMAQLPLWLDARNLQKIANVARELSDSIGGRFDARPQS